MHEPIRSTTLRPRSPATRAWLRLLRVCHRIERTLGEDLRDHNLSLAQFDVVAHVGSAEGMTQQELAGRLLVTKGNVCQLLDRLEAARLIERRREGRSNRLYLTAGGRTLFEELLPGHEARIAEQLSSLSAVEQLQLLGLLRRLDRAPVR
jgi:DNA-binding MarR family transcriptional regulator